MAAIELVDLAGADLAGFTRQMVECLVITADGQVLLQYRPPHWRTFPDCLCHWGGGIETGESPLQAIQRELKEELGAMAVAANIVALGAITEAMTGHSELIHTYFWQDRGATITGCYEAEARRFPNGAAALAESQLTDSTKWLLHKCGERRLLSLE